MNLIEIFSIITIHWFADFLMQDEKWALGKSKNWGDLLSHTITYTIVFGCLVYWITFGYLGVTGKKISIHNELIFYFLPITFLAHTATDYITSRIVSKKFAKGEYGSAIPNMGAFTIIGIDQVLHYIQLFTTYYLLK